MNKDTKGISCKKIVFEKIADVMVKDTLGWLISSFDQFGDIESAFDDQNIDPTVLEIVKAYLRKLENIKKNMGLASNGDYSSDNIINIISQATDVVLSKVKKTSKFISHE